MKLLEAEKLSANASAESESSDSFGSADKWNTSLVFPHLICCSDANLTPFNFWIYRSYSPNNV
jgi:hypothetical protein